MEILTPLPRRKIINWNNNTLILRQCPVCNAKNETKYKRPDGLEVAQCGQCGLFYINTIPSEQNISRLYDTYWSEYRPSFPKLDKIDYSEVPLSIKCLKKFILLPGANVLDIGCGLGLSLFHLKKLGAIACGIDLDREVCNTLREYGLPVSCGNFLEVNYKEESFDAIIMGNLVEHLEQPMDFLRRAHALLKKNGLLIITTPNGEIAPYTAYDKYYFLKVDLEHLQYFNSESISFVANKVKFRIENLVTWGRPGFGAAEDNIEKLKLLRRKTLNMIMSIIPMRVRALIRGIIDHLKYSWLDGSYHLLVCLRKS